MAFIIGEGINNLNLYQANHTVYGEVKCLWPEDCIDIQVTLEQKGIAEIPNRWSKTIKVDEEGKYIFKAVPKIDFVIKVEHR